MHSLRHIEKYHNIEAFCDIFKITISCSDIFKDIFGSLETLFY
jgi:hypothetical protein